MINYSYKMVAAMDFHKKASYALLVVLSIAAVAHSEAMTLLLPPICLSKHIPHIKINTALLTIHNDESMHKAVYLYTQSEECCECEMQSVAAVKDNCTVRLDTRWSTRVEIRVKEDDKFIPASHSCSEAQLTQLFQEGGMYSLYIRSEGPQNTLFNITCIPIVLSNDPSDANIPIYVAMGLFCYLFILYAIIKFAYRKGYIHRFCCFWSTESMMSDLGPPNNINHIDDGTNSSEQQQAPVKKERLKSLDTMRGLSIVIMIFVNYGGGKYWFFKHSKWNGLTVADLVFPWFVFMMGTSMVYSIRSQVLRNVPKWRIWARIFRRSLTLFFLGLIINSSGKKDGVDLETFRIPGVLQRFGGTYLITSTIYLFLSYHRNGSQYSRFAAIRDLTDSVFEWMAHLCLAAIQLVITFFLPVPGCPTGYLGPGGLSQGGKYFNCTGGAAGLIDRKVFGEAHIYQHPTSTEIYHQTVGYDPEGLLGTINSCLICFLGLQAGKIIVSHKDWVKRCHRFFIWTLALGAIGTILCKASVNDGWIPINKNLWSMSFVLVLGSMGFFLLMILYIMIDVYKVWSGAPLYHAGMNAIALYCGHEFFSGRFPVAFSVPQTHAAQLSLNIWGATFWVLVAIYLNYKEIYITV